MTEDTRASGDMNLWRPVERSLVFALASSSLACLLAHFYQLCSMRAFALFVFLPAMAVLFGFASFDRWRAGSQLWRAVWVGVVGGLVAALVYDLFRAPFVFADQWGIASVVPPMRLFKVFPQFGAMILGQPLQQAQYSTAAQAVGWAYHFSNGATIGVMYMALIGDAVRRPWGWAVLLAVGLEAGMLLTPYARIFQIAVDARFVAVTMAAHALFGIGLGLVVRWLATRRVATEPAA